MGNNFSSNAGDGPYYPPRPSSTEGVGYIPPSHHPGRRIFGRDDRLTAAAVDGPPDMSRVVVDYLYLASVDGATLINAFAVDSCQLGMCFSVFSSPL
jgi:hypothetical protein